MLSLAYAIGFAGTHENQSVVGCQGRIVSVDSIQCKSLTGWKLQHFGPRSMKLGAELLMLPLCCRKVWRMMEAEILPASDTLRVVPAGGSRRANQHTLQGSHHRMSIEACLGQNLSHCSLKVTLADPYRNLPRARRHKQWQYRAWLSGSFFLSGE